MSKSIGWRRLFLTGAQKFLLDMSRLGSNVELDKTEKFIIFLEGLRPRISLDKAKRNGRRLLINLYWHLFPKRLKVHKSKNPVISQYLPWFKRGKYEQHLYRLGGDGKILVASSGTGYNSKRYTYSWKKAYFIMLQLKKEVEQEELQLELNYQLSQLSREDE